MNIEHPSALRHCTSCGFCGAVCPTQAITVTLNEDGFYRPSVDSKKCIDCSLCVKSCYKFDSHIQEGMAENIALFAAASEDENLLLQTTSGGIADLLAKSLIKEGFTCIGVIYDSEKNIAIGKCARTEDDTKPFRGSKYIQSYSVDAFKQLTLNCKQEKFAIFGLPCHIYAISRFLNSRNIREKHLLIDLYCHGCPSMNVWSKYLAEKKITDKLKEVCFRSKKRGWGRFCVNISTDTRNLISPKYGDAFYTLFFSDLVLNTSCSDCKLRSSLHYCDIRLGDFWGKEFLSNSSGVSAVTLCSENGEKAFEIIKEKIFIKEKPLSSFLPFQSFGKNYSVNPQQRRILLEMLRDPSVNLESVVKRYNSTLTLKQKVAGIVKHVFRLMPLRVENFIKGLR